MYKMDNIISLAESEDEAKALIEELYESQNEGPYNFDNPFESWAVGQTIFITIVRVW